MIERSVSGLLPPISGIEITVTVAMDRVLRGEPKP